MIAFALACQPALVPSSNAMPSALNEASPDASGGPQFTSATLLPAAMSLVVPGSGQVMQGRLEKGMLHLGAATVLSLLMFNAESQQANVSGAASSGAGVRTLSAAALLGLALWSPLDAWLFGVNDHKSE